MEKRQVVCPVTIGSFLQFPLRQYLGWGNREAAYAWCGVHTHTYRCKEFDFRIYSKRETNILISDRIKEGERRLIDSGAANRESYLIGKQLF